MRNHIDAVKKLFEADETKTKKVTDIKFADPMSKGELTANRRGNTGVSSRDIFGTPGGKAATRATIKPLNRQSTDWIADLPDDLVDPEDPTDHVLDVHADEPEPPTTENLPATVSKAMWDPNTKTGKANPNLTWHQVKNLPGYAKTAIRAIGRVVFAPFTTTPIDDIQVLSTLSNSEIEVKAMISWLVRNGVKVQDTNLDFNGRIFPGYNPEIKLYRALDYEFMCVKDHEGYYVYAWPATANRLDQEQNRLAEFKQAVAETKSTMWNTIYPDSEGGARLALLSMGSKLVNQVFKDATFTPDPYVDGVWLATSESGSKAIVYLAGYKEPSGQTREHNDLETDGSLTENNDWDDDVDSQVNPDDYIGSEVLIKSGRPEFVGKTGRIVGCEDMGQQQLFRVELAEPVFIRGQGYVDDDLWELEYLELF